MGSLNTNLGKAVESPAMGVTDSPALKSIEPKAAVPAKKIKKIKVLIAEDEKPLARALELKLQKEGIDTVVVSNGEAAEEELKKKIYDLAILDLVMPLMDGFDVLQKIQGKNIRTIILVVSNLSQDEDKLKVKDLGAKEFFVKSDTPLATLVEYIRNTYTQ